MLKSQKELEALAMYATFHHLRDEQKQNPAYLQITSGRAELSQLELTLDKLKVEISSSNGQVQSELLKQFNSLVSEYNTKNDALNAVIQKYNQDIHAPLLWK